MVSNLVIRVLETDRKSRSLLMVVIGKRRIGEKRVDIVSLVCSPSDRKVIETNKREKKNAN
ncbi:MAG: hypothetical protein WBB67_07980 [bacterium]